MFSVQIGRDFELGPCEEVSAVPIRELRVHALDLAREQEDRLFRQELQGHQQTDEIDHDY
jgi:hypothetical protein